MRIGVLVAHKNNLKLAVTMAEREFTRANHTDGYEPQEVHLNPEDTDPGMKQVGGYPVFINHEVAVGHLRLCTKNLTVMEEFYRDRQAVGHLIDAAA